MTTRTFGPLRAQCAELSMVDHDDRPLPDGMAAVTFMMPVESARRAGEAMFLWADMTLAVTTDADDQREGDP